MESGEVIRAVRQSAGLGQEELAHKLGIARSTLARIESGEIQPSRLMIEKLYEVSNFAQKRLSEAVNSLTDMLMKKTNFEGILEHPGGGGLQSQDSTSQQSSSDAWATFALLGMLYLWGRDKD